LSLANLQIESKLRKSQAETSCYCRHPASSNTITAASPHPAIYQEAFLSSEWHYWRRGIQNSSVSEGGTRRGEEEFEEESLRYEVYIIEGFLRVRNSCLYFCYLQ